MSTESKRLQWCAASYRSWAVRIRRARQQGAFVFCSRIEMRAWVSRCLKEQRGLIATRRKVDDLRAEEPEYSQEYAEILQAIEECLNEFSRTICILRRCLRGEL